MALDRFSTAAQAWFNESFASPTHAQAKGWEAIGAGHHTLIHAPTGSGKTFAAFLWAIDQLSQEPIPNEANRCRVLYISPMRALAYDVERNLRAPLAGIQMSAQRLGVQPPTLTTAMRTGDTPAKERQSMLRLPPDILITTPESLYLMLTSRAREMLRSIRWVIVDEIHAVAATKRGSHLAVSLERLSTLTAKPPQRIGLSATQRPLHLIAEFLGGGEVTGDEWQPRHVEIVDSPRHKQMDIRIVVPVEDMTRPEETPPTASTSSAGFQPTRSIWPAMYQELLEQIRAHTSTLVFVNSRGLAERLAAELNRLAGEEIVQSHHGSVSREQRVAIEGRLKDGELKGVVATSTLELGIDMAAVDLVLLVGSPNSVSSGLQRVGRAGHQVGAPSVARIFPKHRRDLLETTVVVDRMYAGAIEAIRIPRNPLDVLAQQIVAMTAVETRTTKEVLRIVRRAAPYRDLSEAAFESVLDMLAGRYPSDDFASLKPRIVWDRTEGIIRARSNARLLAVTNPGTIPDRGLYTVVLPEGGRVGELDEEMVYECRPGDSIVLGSSTWRISEIDNDRVIVLPVAAGSAARVPFWHGDGPGRPLELGRAVGEFVRMMGALGLNESRRQLHENYRLDKRAANNLAQLFAEEQAATGALPSDRTIVVEQFRDPIGDWRIAILSPLGAMVHAPWALAARRRLRRSHGDTVDVIWSDDGIMFRFPDVDNPPPASSLIIAPDDLKELLIEEVGDSALFTSRFREAAARALLLPRRRPGRRTPLWLQRRRAADLLRVAKQYPAFPIVMETYREILQDHFDMPAVTEVAADIAAGRIQVHEVELPNPSPMASSLMFDFLAAFIYEYDAPVAEKRVAALTLDRSLLRDILGDPDFRDLIGRDVLDSVDLDLQHLSPHRKATSLDQMHDLLRDLGPLTAEAIARRTAPAASSTGWVDELVRQRRVVVTRFNGADAFAAIEDVGRLRDALGIKPPPGVAESLLAPVEDPLGDVVGRYARTHGPFLKEQITSAVGLPAAVTDEVLKRLESTGRLSRGTYRQGTDTPDEWVDVDVLRNLRRRSLAKLRQDVEPVGASSVGRFLSQWHGIGQADSDPQRLLDILRMLQGSALSASQLEASILPARMGYKPQMLDELLTAGDVVWIGRQPIGARDGKVAIYLREQVPALYWELEVQVPTGEIHQRLRAHMLQRGASFFGDLYAAAGGGDPAAVLDALWELVWAGEVTNDTLAPLRAFLQGISKSRKPRRPAISSATPPAASGRWSLVADLLNLHDPFAPEAKATAQAEQLFWRHGVVTRAAVLNEAIPGGFAGLYPAFRAFEDAGKARRGYFIDGQGGAQFALPGAVDRLRTTGSAGMVVLSAVDPANPYGSVLPWPDTPPPGRMARRPGALVAIFEGDLVTYLEGGGRRILTNHAADEVAASAIQATLATVDRPQPIQLIDQVPVSESPLAGQLLERGFRRSYKGLTLTDRV